MFPLGPGLSSYHDSQFAKWHSSFWMLTLGCSSQNKNSVFPTQKTHGESACPWWISMQGRNFIPSGQQAANLGRQELGEGEETILQLIQGPFLPPRSRHVLEVFLW